FQSALRLLDGQFSVGVNSQAIRNGFTPRFGPVLSIELHENLPDGSLKRAPWSTRSIETAQARLEGMKSQFQGQYEQYLAASRLAS
ncbi:hypothetical protein, partial [Hydrogenophaga sp.]|uniref:hypothetical protein n=1 Tax=Hydrogenophaga sp. TaxID=1904254 RepID=UPI00262EE729